MPVQVPFSDRIVFYLCSRHPERHHPTLLVLAHLHHSLHRLFDRRGHRLGSLGTWDAERQQPTHPAEGWRAGGGKDAWCMFYLLCGSRTIDRFRRFLSYSKQFQFTAVGGQGTQRSAKVSFAKTHSANQTCVVQVLLFAAGLFFFGLGLLTERQLKQLVLKKWPKKRTESSCKK